MGVLISIINEGWPPKSKFSVDDIPDLSGKVILVTGGNRGIGFEIVKALLNHNAKVYIATRSEEAAAKAIAELKDITGHEALFIRLDLSDPRSVKVAAEEFLSKETELHTLFNNGGIMGPPLADVSVDNYDLSHATNVMGPYFLTVLLMPALLAGARASADGKARIVNTASIMHRMGGIDFNTFIDGPARAKFGEFALYCQSKNATVVFSQELARRYGDQGIVSTAVNPGNLDTDLMRHLSPMEKAVVSPWLYPVHLGALTPLYAGTSAESKDFNGQYFIPWARLGKPRADTQDEAIGKELWAWLEEHTKALVARQ